VRDKFLPVLTALSALMAVVFIVFIMVLSAGSPASASQRVELQATVWTPVSATASTFALQSLCSERIFIQPSPGDPGGDDSGASAFRVEPRAVWNQTIATADRWWARSASGQCAVIVEDIL